MNPLWAYTFSGSQTEYIMPAKNSNLVSESFILFCTWRHPILWYVTFRMVCINLRVSITHFVWYVMNYNWYYMLEWVPSKHNDGHNGQTVLFLFHQTRGHFSKKYDLCPHVQLQTVAFLWRFWSSGFFLAGYVRLCRYRTRFTVNIDTFVPVSSSIFTRTFAVVLGLICTFRTK